RCSSSELRSRKTRPGEQLYTGGAEFMAIDFGALARELSGGAAIVTARSCPPLLVRRGSIPLLLAIRAAALALAEPAGES
ncbi:MAG: hypothetical protein ACRDPW_10525, partial [Mycobacteriales bacterium]